MMKEMSERWTKMSDKDEAADGGLKRDLCVTISTEGEKVTKKAIGGRSAELD